MIDWRDILEKAGHETSEGSYPNFRVVCLSPNHHDTNPSMSIHRDTGDFKCFGCGMRGGPKRLARILQGDLPLGPDGQPETDIVAMADRLAREALKERIRAAISAPYRPAVEKTFPTYPELPGESWRGSYRGLSAATCEAFGLLNFEGRRIIYPVTHGGRFVGYYARNLPDCHDPIPHYYFPPRNSDDKTTLHWSQELLWPELDCERGSDIILTEGLYDALHLVDMGFNAFAICGTENLGASKIQQIMRLGPRKVYIMLDGDLPGWWATIKVYRGDRTKDRPALSEYVDAVPVFLPQGAEVTETGQVKWTKIDPGMASFEDINTWMNDRSLRKPPWEHPKKPWCPEKKE